MLKFIRIGAIAIIALVLVIALSFFYWQSTWAKPVFRTPDEAFAHGSIGAEIMPLPAFQVLPDLFPDQFQPAGKKAGDWIDQFGFIHGNPEENEGLPVGFSLSNYQPQTGQTAPVKFVGFSCALCHSSLIRRSPEDPGLKVIGMGSTSLDLFGWVDALKTSLLDEKRLTPATIAAAYEAKYDKALNLVEKIAIRVWLSTARKQIKGTLPKWDAPFSGKDVRNSTFEPIGPGRTQPFRELVRFAMDRPGATDRSFSKLPSLFEQKNRDWAQFDGSIRDPLSRSVLAATAAGATPQNLVIPEITHNVTQANNYTQDLRAPSFTEVFKDQGITLDTSKAERGQKVYAQHCSSCHGFRQVSNGDWVKGSQQGELTPVAEIGTDPQRLRYRYYQELPDAVDNYFPKNNPLKPNREDIRPGPLGDTNGYINAALESIFARAPYLHNGSILTLAELINLQPRRDVFYRGRNLYDPINVGLVSPKQPDEKHYFTFDASLVGNSNQGHDYPWSYQGAGWDQSALEDLLEYLKTL